MIKLSKAVINKNELLVARKVGRKIVLTYRGEVKSIEILYGTHDMENLNKDFNIIKDSYR